MYPAEGCELSKKEMGRRVSRIGPIKEWKVVYLPTSEAKVGAPACLPACLPRGGGVGAHTPASITRQTRCSLVSAQPAKADWCEDAWSGASIHAEQPLRPLGSACCLLLWLPACPPRRSPCLCHVARPQVMLRTNNGLYECTKAGAAYRKLFSSLEEQLEITTTVYHALCPAAPGGSMTASLDEVVARMARSKVGAGRVLRGRAGDMRMHRQSLARACKSAMMGMWHLSLQWVCGNVLKHASCSLTSARHLLGSTGV